MVVAHLAERTPEIHCTNSIIGKLNCLKDENKVKEAGITYLNRLCLHKSQFAFLCQNVKYYKAKK